MISLKLTGVSFAYGSTAAVADVTLEVSAGETVALLGHNGAGKTTLTRLVMGLLHPSAGEILVLGIPSMDQAPEEIARDAAYVFQHPAQQLFARTVIEEVAFGPRQLGRSDLHARDRAYDALMDLGLEARADEHPYDLPAAERKLVTIAAALAQEPRLLILDEPTQGLDAAARDRVCGVLARATAEGLAVLAVTHDLAFVAERADRAVVMNRGAVVADRPARDLVGDEPAALRLGLEIPPAVRLASSLRLPGSPVRAEEVAGALRAHLSRNVP